MPVFKEVEDIFSICCNYTFLIVDHIIFHIIGIFKNINKKKGLQYWVVYHTGNSAKHP